jgi:hypothetical protein
MDAEQSTDEFDAAFIEAASDAPNTDQGPGEVEQDGEAFDEAFSEAAGEPAANQEEDDSVEAKLAKLESENERIKQSERSQRGRLSALSRKLVDLQKVEIVKPEPVQGESENWKEFKEDFPEMAATVEARLNQADDKINQMMKTVEAVTATQETIVEKEVLAYKETQYDILATRHPDFDQIKGSQEFEAFKASANVDIQAKIKSRHADDAIDVLDAFKAQTGWKTKTESRGKSDVEKINERRTANLKNSVGVSSKNVGHSAKVDAGSEDDFDAAFAARSATIEKRRRSFY